MDLSTIVNHIAHFSLAVVFVGLMVGFFVGLTGVGGGVILAPVLIWLGIQPSVAVGTDLVYGSVTKLVATYRNVKEKRVDWQWVGALALGSLPAGLAGSFTVHWLRLNHPNAESLILKALGAVLALAAVLSLLSDLWLKRRNIELVADWTPATSRNVVKVAIAGALVGFLVGLTSVGSGSLYAMLFMFTSRLRSQQLVGTDIAHATLLVAVCGLAHLDFGTVNLTLAANLLVGSIPGVLLGSRLMAHAPARSLKLGISSLVLLAGVRMFA